MKKNLEDFGGEQGPIFIDANIFLHHAFGTNEISVDFLKGVESSAVKAYTSALVMEEVFFKLMIQSASNFLPKVTVEGAKAILKDQGKREKILKPVMEYRDYITLLKKFGLTILEVTDKDMAASIRYSRQYGFLPADATHLAVLERKEIRNLASGDSDFDAVTNVTRWSPDLRK
jgi:predicted nucleic acid-binding protein